MPPCLPAAAPGAAAKAWKLTGTLGRPAAARRSPPASWSARPGRGAALPRWRERGAGTAAPRGRRAPPLAGEAGAGGPPLVRLAGQSPKAAGGGGGSECATPSGREARRDAVGSSLRGTARAPPPRPGAIPQRLALRPLLGARSREAEREHPAAGRSLLPPPTTMSHFNKGPSYGLSAEVKNKVRRGAGGAPATGRRRTALPPRSSALRPSAAEASKRRRAAACPHPVPGSRRPPRPLFWLCSCAAGRTSGGRGFPAPGVPPRAPGAAVSLVAAGRAPPGRGRSCVVTHP